MGRGIARKTACLRANIRNARHNYIRSPGIKAFACKFIRRQMKKSLRCIIMYEQHTVSAQFSRARAHAHVNAVSGRIRHNCSGRTGRVNVLDAYLSPGIMQKLAWLCAVYFMHSLNVE